MPNGSCDSVLICMTNIYTNTFTVKFRIKKAQV